MLLHAERNMPQPFCNVCWIHLDDDDDDDGLMDMAVVVISI